MAAKPELNRSKLPVPSGPRIWGTFWPALLPLVDTGLCPNLVLCIGGLRWHFIYMTQVPPECPCATR